MQCSKIVEGGLQCGAEAMRDSLFCNLHDERPDVIRRAQEARRRGGRAAHASPGPVDVMVDFGSGEGILSTLQRTAEALARGSIDRSRANALAYISTAATNARKHLDYENRLRRIEKRLRLRENPLEEDDPEAEDDEPT
jgi:hypothetical protein